MCNEFCALCCVRNCCSVIRCWLCRCAWIEKARKRLEFKPHPYQVYTSSFQKCLRIRRLYFLFRWVIFFLCLASVIVTFGEFGGRNAAKKRPLSFYAKYPIYLTYLTLLLAAIQTMMAVILLTNGIFKNGANCELPCGGKLTCWQLIYYKLMVINTTMALTITTVFWLAIFHRIPNAEVDGNNILAHATNSLYALVDFTVNGMPYSFSDILWILLYNTIYVIFTFIYWHAGGWPRPLPGEDEPSSKVIYPKCLDWTTFKHPVTCGLAVTCHIIVWHIVMCGLMQLKWMWMRRCDDDCTSETSSTTSDCCITRRSMSSKVTPGGDMPIVCRP